MKHIIFGALLLLLGNQIEAGTKINGEESQVEKIPILGGAPIINWFLIDQTANGGRRTTVSSVSYSKSVKTSSIQVEISEHEEEAVMEEVD